MHYKDIGEEQVVFGEPEVAEYLEEVSDEPKAVWVGRLDIFGRVTGEVVEKQSECRHDWRYIGAVARKAGQHMKVCNICGEGRFCGGVSSDEKA